MSSETATATVHESSTSWPGAAVAGIAAGVVMGVMMTAMMRDVIEMMIPAMYGLAPGLALGWAFHLFHSAVFGLVYAGLVQFDPLAPYATRVGAGTGLGIAYGIGVWVIAAAVVMPIWLGMPEMVPNLNPMSLVGHVVYGAILGGLYPVLSDRL